MEPNPLNGEKPHVFNTCSFST